VLFNLKEIAAENWRWFNEELLTA